MKKKHYIKTIEDIKHCEENGIELYDEYQATVCYRFVDGIWCSYTNKNLNVYNVRLSLNSLYYEEESEEQQEVTEKDVGKLCWFYKDVGKLCWFYTEDDTKEDERDIGILTGMPYEKGDSRHYEMDNTYYYKHCRRLSPAEVAEMTGYGVTEDGDTFYGEPFKIVGKEK